MVGFDMSFIQNGDRYDVSDAKYSLRQKKALGASVGIGDYFNVGVRGMSKVDIIIGALRDVQNLPPGRKGKHFVDIVQNSVDFANKAQEKKEEIEQKIEDGIAIINSKTAEVKTEVAKVFDEDL